MAPEVWRRAAAAGEDSAPLAKALPPQGRPRRQSPQEAGARIDGLPPATSSSHPSPAHDRADLTALRDGEDAALTRLIGRWEKPLFGFAWRYLGNAADARDLAVETFVRLHQCRELSGADTNLPAWLFTTQSRLCQNHQRWRRRHPGIDLEAGRSLPDGRPILEDEAEYDEVQAALAVAIERLPHELKTALLLHYFERFSSREIAAVSGCSERGVKTRLCRARRCLRTELAAFLSGSVEA